jgi:hypothetical protein
MADKISRLEDIRIKDKFNYNEIQSLSTEARQKLTKINPKPSHRRQNSRRFAKRYFGIAYIIRKIDTKCFTWNIANKQKQ